MMIKTLTAILGAFLMLSACSDKPGAKAEDASQQSDNSTSSQMSMDNAVMVDYEAILNAADRSDADKEEDSYRKPADVLKIMNVQPGQMILDIGAGSGYYTEVFARVLGPTGMVHAINMPSSAEKYPQIVKKLDERKAAVTNGRIYPEVTKFEEIKAHKPADAAFLGLMYHEIIRQGVDAMAFNRAVYNSLRPGGLYVIEIHNAKNAAGPGVSDSLHRTDPLILEKQVQGAGFVLVAKNTTLLGNPDDPKDITVFDPSIRHHTDRTLYIFKRPN